MSRNAVYDVLKYVLNQHVSTEGFRDGFRTGTHAEFHMNQADAATVLNYIMQKLRCPAEQAMQLFMNCRNDVLQIKSQSSRGWRVTDGVCISVFVLICLGVMLLAFEGAGWMKVILLAALILLFFALLLLLAWRPRRMAMDETWRCGSSLSQRLDTMHRIQEMPIIEVIGIYQRKQGLVFAAAALICFIGFPAAWGSSMAADDAFHRKMVNVAVSAENEGTRYVVYDVDEGRYINKYLSPARQASSHQDVRGVLKIDAEKKSVGMYSNYSVAYQQYVVISLVDQRTGDVVRNETVYGGEPPLTIRNVGGGDQNGSGTPPRESDIAEACERLIQYFENN